MGDRYILTVTCPLCGAVDDDVYYAPTCEIVTWICECGEAVDLEKLTGISREDASNADQIRELCENLKTSP